MNKKNINMKHRIALFIAFVVRSIPQKLGAAPSKASINRAALMGGILRTTGRQYDVCEYCTKVELKNTIVKLNIFMNAQLEIKFNTGQQYIMTVDGKRDFVVYNMDVYEINNDNINAGDLVIMELDNKVIDKLKSEAWSSNCRWFFVIQDEGIYLFNVYSNIVWLCKKHSFKFIEMYLNKNIQHETQI